MLEVFRDVPKLMAPGASVLFEGCETGEGAGGTDFMKAAAALFFGDEKWGYVRAHTQKTETGSFVHHGLQLHDAKVLRWPEGR